MPCLSHFYFFDIFHTYYLSRTSPKVNTADDQTKYQPWNQKGSPWIHWLHFQNEYSVRMLIALPLSILHIHSTYTLHKYQCICSVPVYVLSQHHCIHCVKCRAVFCEFECSLNLAKAKLCGKATMILVIAKSSELISSFHMGTLYTTR